MRKTRLFFFFLPACTQLHDAICFRLANYLVFITALRAYMNSSLLLGIFPKPSFWRHPLLNPLVDRLCLHHIQCPYRPISFLALGTPLLSKFKPS